MIKNINDVFSLISLIIVVFFAFRFFIGSLITNESNDESYSKRYLLSNYLDNEEE